MGSSPRSVNPSSRLQVNVHCFIVIFVANILYLYSGSDIQNLIQFLYTGKTSLSGKEFDIFQQIICELQIVTEGERHIILEEITPIHQNADTALVVTEKEVYFHSYIVELYSF